MSFLRKMIPVAAILLAFFTLGASPDDPLDEARRLTSFGVDAATRGLWDEALFRWEQAVSYYPNFPAAHNNLAVVYEHLGRYEEAREHYRLAYDMSRKNRFIESNGRMFLQFYHQHIAQRDDEEDEEEEQPAEEVEAVTVDQVADRGEVEEPEPMVADPDSEVYHKVGSSSQVLIKHPKRETALSGRFSRVYIAGFSPANEEQKNLNFETTEYFRSELRKYTLYDVIPLEELDLPSAEDEFFDLVDDNGFWQDMGNKVGADLVVCGRVNFYAEPSDGFYPYEYRDYRTGGYRTGQLLIQRTAMTIEMDMFFYEVDSGEIVYEESFGQTIVYRGRLDPTLQAFYDVMNRILPRFMDILVPREHDAIRFLLRG